MTNSDIEIIHSADILVRQHGRFDALNISRNKVEELLKQGDRLGVMVWQRISAAIQESKEAISP